VPALDLERMSWPEVREEIEAGRDTIVLSFGAVEQHGLHLPLGTDSIFGDELGRSVAERLDAFHAPTVRVGCSRHHLAFPGTMSVEEETFHGIVGDIVRGWARHGSSGSSWSPPTAATSLRSLPRSSGSAPSRE
jgi:creatinine amidohydrolase